MSVLWRADELAAALGAARGAARGTAVGFAASGVCIDTRTLVPGDLFVALQGERDGHDFVGQALAQGAAGALVSRAVPGADKVIMVDDTLAALRRLAAFARARAAAQVVAVTGSVGKTTTKEMLRRVLANFGTVHAAEASFNNHIGVPLTLARLPAAADFAVLEIGMNHPGEIAPLAALAAPDVAVVTNVERAHIGLMGSLAAIAAEKAMIFAGLTAGGTAVLPAGSAFFATLAAAVPPGAQRLPFGDGQLLAAQSDAEGCDVAADFAGVQVRFRLAAPGRHMAVNALAVLCVAQALRLDLAKAAAALDGFAPYAGRGARRRIAVAGQDVLLLDESYNASSASMRAALSVLALQPGRHVAVLGDMLELGEDAAAEHLALLDDLAPADLVFTCGPMMQHLFAALPRRAQGAHEADAVRLAPHVRNALQAGDTVLVKGSYGSRMRDVIALLQAAA